MAIRFTKQDWIPTATGAVLYVEGFCKSSDITTAPTGGYCTGSSLTAVDTGDKYYYDESDSTWAVPTPGS